MGLFKRKKESYQELYHTKFGEFIIVTKPIDIPAERGDGTKLVFESTKTYGYFKDYPEAVEFKMGAVIKASEFNNALMNSQGDNCTEWLNFIGTRDYDKAIDIVYDEVLHCFRDYYDQDEFERECLFQYYKR